MPFLTQFTLKHIFELKNYLLKLFYVDFVMFIYSKRSFFFVSFNEIIMKKIMSLNVMIFQQLKE